ncbi:MAG: hypothetical protein FD123_3958 [Bacteroidetes bacterium]|nr:MAG: hypothetical protein FD123_3958 [Bacteroidota bacterium]
MKIKCFVSALFLLLTVIPGQAQQDPQYSQYMFNPMVINPAYAGSRGIMNGSLVLRKQWVGFPGAPSTEAFAFNTPTKKGKVGLGLQFVADQIGPKSSLGFMTAYTYRFPLGKGKFGMGIGAGLMSYRINWNQITYRDAGDAYDALADYKKTFPDFSFGLFYNTKSFYVGVSTTHLNRGIYGVHIDSLNTITAHLAPHNFFTIGKAFEINENVIFSPSLMVKSVVPVSIPNIDLNANFQFKNTFWVGISGRSDRSIVALVQYRIGDKVKVGYAYDMSTGRLKNQNSGTHELMLGYDLDLFKVKTLSPRYF